MQSTAQGETSDRYLSQTQQRYAATSEFLCIHNLHSEYLNQFLNIVFKESLVEREERMEILQRFIGLYYHREQNRAYL